MKKVVDKLKQYSKTVNLTERFDYNFDLNDEIFIESEKDKLRISSNPFEQNSALKWILKEKYQSAIVSETLDFWIINAWGGIRGFKPNRKNIDKIKSFKKQLDKKRLSLDSFSTISSLSKLSSFMRPEDYVIYDSRVIFTLNWLILTCENSEEFTTKYFPMPSGRNRILADFDMNTIIHISHLDIYPNKENLYISQQEAYFDFCQFVKSNVKVIYGQQAHPYELEMLLFTLADREIFEDMKTKLR